MIPNVIHFIFGLKEDFGGRPFSFLNFLAIHSAQEVNKPDQIFFYYAYEPHGQWWEASKKYITPVRIQPPKEIYGRPLREHAHQTDVLRLQILLERGGIYLDTDVICLNPFAAFRGYDCVMSQEKGVGLGNSVILAKPNAEFLRLWLESFKDFRSKGCDEYYAEHAVFVPLRIARRYPRLIHIENRFLFFSPHFHEFDMIFRSYPKNPLVLFKKNRSLLFANMICFQACSLHLCALWNWERYLQEITPEYLERKNNNFTAVCKFFFLPRRRANVVRDFFVVLVRTILDLSVRLKGTLSAMSISSGRRGAFSGLPQE